MNKSTKIIIKYIVLLVFSILCLCNVKAGIYDAEIYRCFVYDDMPRWKSIIDEMQRQKNKSNDFTFALVDYQYGYIGWAIGAENKEEAAKYVPLLEGNIEMLVKANYKPSQVNAYRSAMYGFKIAVDMMKLPTCGRKSVKYSLLAIDQDSSNYNGYIQYGNFLYHTPSLLGGSKEISLEYYKIAEKLCEYKMDEFKEKWNYLALLTMIAIAYENIKDYDMAKFYYEKCLKIAPDYVVVKDDYYPYILKLIKENE